MTRALELLLSVLQLPQKDKKVPQKGQVEDEKLKDGSREADGVSRQGCA